MAVTTTIVAFMPLLFIAGIMGKFIAVMPTAVIIILIVSLVEALVILPAHLHGAFTRASKRQGQTSKRGFQVRMVKKVDETLQYVINRHYARAIRFVVRNRYFSLCVAIAVLIVMAGLVAGGRVSFVLFPKADSDWMIAEVSYPLGTPVQLTENTLMRIEEAAISLNPKFAPEVKEGEKIIQHVMTLVGQIPPRDWKAGELGGHAGQIWVEILGAEGRPKLRAEDVVNAWRKAVGDIPGVDRLTFSILHGGPAGNPIEVQVIGKDFELLKLSAGELKREIATYPGTYDIMDDFKPGKEEKRLRAHPGAKPLGISLSDIARQVRQAFYGEEAVRIQRGRDDIKVMVRYAEAERRSLAGMEEMRIRTRQGDEVPLEEVAKIDHGHAYSTVQRVDRKRVITVSSDLDQEIANAAEIIADLKANFLPELAGRYPGVSFGMEGEEKRRVESMDSLWRGYILALMGMYLLLATQFRSYIQPVAIMLAIPFGLVGAIIGHLLLGLDVTLMSLFGIVALSGIVVNDSLILIDFINRAIREGVPVDEAVETSGKARFRPVILTSLTTIAGLMPLLLERSFQAQFLIPMAVSICFGLLVATALTLLLVPALYLIIKDMAGFAARLAGKT
jgi:multidrug efflux pump subunit AcrB